MQAPRHLQNTKNRKVLDVHTPPAPLTLLSSYSDSYSLPDPESVPPSESTLPSLASSSRCGWCTTTAHSSGWGCAGGGGGATQGQGKRHLSRETICFYGKHVPVERYGGEGTTALLFCWNEALAGYHVSLTATALPLDPTRRDLAGLPLSAAALARGGERFFAGDAIGTPIGTSTDAPDMNRMPCRWEDPKSQIDNPKKEIASTDAPDQPDALQMKRP